MHIPDGYLSPATCAVLYAGAAPFWVIALQRVRKVMRTRLVPLLSVFAAFSFVVMMFNLPLPGGTTGHAVGVGIATIVLGPWASILAVSVALLIQALFFGDGGITAFGANCFNMAIVGSLVAHATYQLIAGRAPLESKRRVVAAGVAGYLALNIAALVASFEFGIQPALFHDAAGAPLYAPYPLHIAVPAMMLGHLTWAGIAELILTAGIVAYLQRADISLLKTTAQGVLPRGAVLPDEKDIGGGWRAARPLWIGLAVMMILTPLGLLAAGTAWGEWGAEDFADAGARAEIAAVTLNQAPPSKAPAGLEKLSSVWSAPLPDYAPPWMKSAQLGYMLSALLGVGLILSVCLLIGTLARGNRPQME